MRNHEFRLVVDSDDTRVFVFHKNLVVGVRVHQYPVTLPTSVRSLTVLPSTSKHVKDKTSVKNSHDASRPA